MTYQKGFKQSWLQVYKAKYGQARNLTKENWDYECCTMRRQFKGLITGCDSWSNFVFVHAGREFGVFLLSEEDMEEADDVEIVKLDFESNIRQMRVIERDWNMAEVIIVFESLAMHKYALEQTDVSKFKFVRTHELPPVCDRNSKIVV